MFVFICLTCGCEWSSEKEDVDDLIKRSMSPQECDIIGLCPVCCKIGIGIVRGE